MGSTGILHIEPGSQIPLAATRDGWTLSDAGAAPKLLVANNTPVRIVEIDERFEVYRVRITAGAKAQNQGWVPYEWVR